MIVLLQRVLRASVYRRAEPEKGEVEDTLLGSVEKGLLAFVCAEPGDTSETIAKAARKTLRLRVFEDESGRMNRSVQDVGGGLLVVSQFTLAADCMSGNRPSFSGSAQPDVARTQVDAFVAALRTEGLHVETGEFGAHMRVSIENDGPATFSLKF